MRKPTPRRVVRKHRRDLREPEREHEIEEELERSDGLPALSVLLAHERKLARSDRCADRLGHEIAATLDERVGLARKPPRL